MEEWDKLCNWYKTFGNSNYNVNSDVLVRIDSDVLVRSDKHVMTGSSFGINTITPGSYA